jgi:diguanylate cyclase (GGDEF)-like protein
MAQIPDSPRENTRDLVTLLEAMTSISRSTAMEQVAQETTKQIAEFLEADYCCITRWEPETNRAILFTYYAKDENTINPEYKESYNLYDFPRWQRVLLTCEASQISIYGEPASSRERDFLNKVGAKTILVLPLFNQYVKIGLIEVYDNHRVHEFDSQQVARVQLLANHAAIVMEHARRLRETQQRAAELEAIHQASLSLTASLDLQTVLYTILENALNLTEDAMDAHAFMYDGETLSFAAALWADGRRDTQWKTVRKDGLTYTVAKAGAMLVVPDMSAHPLFEDAPSDWTGAIIGIPLKIGDRVVGVMNVAYQYPREFSHHELRVLNLLADQAAIAIENARLHNLVSIQALTDPLTELPNRRAFDQRLDEEIRRSKRYGHSFSLFMIDFNDFKRVNDSHGHLIGDIVLRNLGNFIKSVSRDTDFLARIGGDEFAMFLPETGLSDAIEVGHKLTKAISEYTPYKVGEDEIRVGVSIGAASYPQDAESAKALLNAADRALYKAKGK